MGFTARSRGTTILAPLWMGASAGVMVGGLAGQVMAARTVTMNVMGLSADALALGLYLGIIYGLVGLAAGVAVGVPFSVAAARGRVARPVTVFAATLGIVLGLYLFLSGMRSYNQDLYFYDYSFIHSYTAMQAFFAARVGILLVISVLGGTLVFHLSRRAAGRTVLGLIVIVAGFGLVSNLRSTEPERPTTSRLPVVERDRSLPGVLLIGWDGATWSVMDRLLASGRMPNTQKLMARGSWGRLASPPGTVSADIWTRIYTGKDKDKHGIYGFDYYIIPGLDRAVVPPWRGLGIARVMRFLLGRGWVEVVIANRTLRRATPIWQVMNSMGRSAGVVGPLVSWPAEKVEPFLITSNAGDVAEKIRREALDPSALVTGELFYPPDLDETAQDVILQESRWRDSVGSYLYDIHRPDFFTVYFEEPDRTQHHRWKWMEPQYYAGVTEGDLTKYGGAIEQEYVLADSLLGVFLRLAGDSTTVLVVSDHGFSPAFRGGRQQAGHYGGPDGILIAAGPFVRRGLEIRDGHVHDITPTVLAMMGLPVAEDMDGRVLEELLQPEFLQKHPVMTIPTYETGVSATKVRRSGAEEDLYEKLRALGYVGS